MGKNLGFVSLTALLVVWPSSAWAQPGAASKGEGAIVVVDSTPVYVESSGDAVSYTLNRGEEVASRPSTAAMFLSPHYRFETVDGRVRVNFFPREPELEGKLAMGWVDPAALSVFYFECCDPKGRACGPADLRGLRGKMTWTSCFREARDGYRAQLAPATAPTKTIELGQTEDQVRAALGEPGKILKLDTKSIWVYPDLKVTFESGKVANLE